MDINEAREMFECMENLDSGQLLSYLCKHHVRIQEAAKIGAEAIRQKQALDRLLKFWEVMQ